MPSVKLLLKGNVILVCNGHLIKFYICNLARDPMQISDLKNVVCKFDAVKNGYIYIYIYCLVVWHKYVEYLLIYMRNCWSVGILASFICISWIVVDLSKFTLPCQIDASLTLCNGEDKHHRFTNGAIRISNNMIVVAKYHDINHSG